MTTQQIAIVALSIKDELQGQQRQNVIDAMLNSLNVSDLTRVATALYIIA